MKWDRTSHDLVNDPAFATAVVLAFREHGTAAGVARALEVNISSVSRVIKAHGMVRANGARRPKKEPTAEQIEIARRTWQETRSKKAVAKATGLSMLLAEDLIQRLFPRVV